MELPRTLSFVSYAVNGAGLGHVVRLCAVNRWLRRYATFAQVRSQHVFLTTSEADSWLFHEGFAAFKLPSKSIVETAGLSKPAYLALAKSWVWNTLATLRPDLLIVDTFPNGSFEELAPALDLCGRKALVLRPVNAETAARPGFRALVGLYDRVVVPAGDGVDVPVERADALRRVGPIMRTERWEALPRAEARERLGVADGSTCLLVSGGGGGDESIERFFKAVDAGVGADPGVHVVYAAGPLYRGRPLRGPRRTWWTEPSLAECLTGVDAALSASGFNTVHELLHVGVPTALYAQNKVADDQHARAQSFVVAGAALALEALTPAAVRAALASLRDPENAAGLRRAALEAVADNGARRAAAALLELVLPRSVVRQAVEVLDDDLLARAHGAGLALGDLVDVATALHGGRGPVDRAALELDEALPLLEQALVSGFSARLVARLAGTLGRKFTSGPAVVAQATARLVGHGAAAGQGAALASLVELLGPDRDGSPEKLADEVTTLMDGAAAQGLALHGLVERALRLQNEAPAGGNAAFLRRLRESLADRSAPASRVRSA